MEQTLNLMAVKNLKIVNDLVKSGIIKKTELTKYILIN